MCEAFTKMTCGKSDGLFPGFRYPHGDILPMGIFSWEWRKPGENHAVFLPHSHGLFPFFLFPRGPDPTTFFEADTIKIWDENWAPIFKNMCKIRMAFFGFDWQWPRKYVNPLRSATYEVITSVLLEVLLTVKR